MKKIFAIFCFLFLRSSLVLNGFGVVKVCHDINNTEDSKNSVINQKTDPQKACYGVDYLHKVG